MPQLSLYVNNSILKKVELAAKRENISISQWVRVKIEKSIEKNWSENYFSLFGSIEDETFQSPKKISFKQDSKRQKI
ncbi:MAG: toxin-antitoxin system, antitoxin component [Leptospiraceae bacterium]|nr:toxin-antitoxin system, antitoxin component [Leptospiraceae bacterium]